ncbi:MAG: SH3 domain-containing protein [Prevotellaceae bacterium]|nr:SH3 domain-containing protein [Prevotellaceae bacterium]
MKTKTILLMLLMTVFCLNGWSLGQQVGKKLVYSISTDGFVNVRKTPNASSKIIGVLATNRKGAVLLSSKGTWWKVRVDNVVGYVHSKYVTLSSKPVKISGLPTVHYVVISTCNSMAEVKQFFYNCPDAFDGSPVYKDIEDGKTVYKICLNCYATLSGAMQLRDSTNKMLGDDYAKIWSTQGLAECVYLTEYPSGEMAIPLTPQ